MRTDFVWMQKPFHAGFEWFLDLEPDEQGRRGSEGSKFLTVTPPTFCAVAHEQFPLLM